MICMHVSLTLGLVSHAGLAGGGAPKKYLYQDAGMWRALQG